MSTRAAAGLRVSALAVLLTAKVLAGCGFSSPRSDEEITVWRPLGAWSGRGVLQTDAFMSDTGLLRVGWEARAAAPANSDAGTLRVAVHSAVSGRLLVLAVDQRGAGRNTTYITEDPRSFYLVIESANLEWPSKWRRGSPLFGARATHLDRRRFDAIAVHCF